MQGMDKKPKINSNSGSLIYYLKLVRNNLILLISFIAICISASVYYALTTEDIYKTSTTLKINAQKGNVLENPLMPGVKDLISDRFIANEIETMKNVTLRKQVARVLIDSIVSGNNLNDFSLLLNKNNKKENENLQLLSERAISNILGNIVTIKQKDDLDFIEIIVNSPSARESALIANTYAETYKRFNLLDNRQQLTTIKNFLKLKRDEKYDLLLGSEDRVKSYKLKGSAVKLDEQAKTLIDKITEFESQKNAVDIEISMTREILDEYQKELDEKNPSLKTYLDQKTTEPYLNLLRERIANLETQKANNNLRLNKETASEYDLQINNLKGELNSRLKEFQTMVLSASPAEIKDLTNKIFETKVKYQSLIASSSELNKVIRNYELKFNRLPARTLNLARLEREKLANEKLYMVIEEKYQEALINEQSQPGNILIMNSAEIPSGPAFPNRTLIIILGSILGFGAGFTFIFFKDYFNKTVNSPEELMDAGFSVLSWIPKVPGLKNNKSSELILSENDPNISVESFKTLRTRIQYSKLSDNIKTILITSSSPGEGKTFVAANMAASFALANKRTVLVDCDLRKPRVHKLFKSKDGNGLTNYFFGKCSIEEIFKSTKIRNFEFIPAGTIPPNPSEIVGASQFSSFISDLREEYDYVIIDSPPILAVSDSEILSRTADASILVTRSNETELEWISKSVNLLQHEKDSFIGIILNQYNYKKADNYYKHYSYYSDNGNNRRSKR